MLDRLFRDTFSLIPRSLLKPTRRSVVIHLRRKHVILCSLARNLKLNPPELLVPHITNTIKHVVGDAGAKTPDYYIAPGR